MRSREPTGTGVVGFLGPTGRRPLGAGPPPGDHDDHGPPTAHRPPAGRDTPGEADVTREQRIGLLVLAIALVTIVAMLWPVAHLAFDASSAEVLSEVQER